MARRRAASSSTAAMPLCGRRTSAAGRVLAAKTSSGPFGSWHGEPAWTPLRSRGESGPIDAQSCWDTSWKSATRNSWAAAAAKRGLPEAPGLPVEAIERSRLGLVPSTDEARQALLRAGFRAAEITAAGVCADRGGPGGSAVRGTRFRPPGTVWARSIGPQGAAAPRYLYLRGASRASLVPYGLSEFCPDLLTSGATFSLLRVVRRAPAPRPRDRETAPRLAGWRPAQHFRAACSVGGRARHAVP